MPGAKHWCFTLNNWTPQEAQNIEDAYRNNDDLKYVIYGKEVGVQGTPHLQGFVSFTSRVGALRVKNAVGVRAHVEICRGTIQQAVDYCRKDGDITEFGSMPAGQGKRSDWELFLEWVKCLEQRPSERELIRSFPKLYATYTRAIWSIIDAHLPEVSLMAPDVELRDWQGELEQELEEPADPRKILFYVDPTGNTGKSWFTRYWLSKHGNNSQVLRVGKRDDLAYAIVPSNRVFLFDVPRSQMEFLQYSVLEMLKDRMVFSPKYHSMNKILSVCPHVVVFCNEEPNQESLSMDRYDIRNI